MDETCKARFVVASKDELVPDMLVQCQDGALGTHPRHQRASGDVELLHHAWTARHPSVVWLDRQSVPATETEPDEHVHECSHTDAEHAAGEGMGNGLDGLLRAIFSGRVPKSAQVLQVAAPEPEAPDPLAILLSGLKQMKDAHAAVLGAAAEHRDRAESAGFSPTVAEGMAFMFYIKALGG